MNTRNVKIFFQGVSVYARTLFIGCSVNVYVKILYKHMVGFSGCKRTYTNTQKRLKQHNPPPPQTERKVFGAFSFFRNF